MFYIGLWFLINFVIWTLEDFNIAVIQIAFFPLTIIYFMMKSLIGFFGKLRIVKIPKSESNLALWEKNKLHWLLGINNSKLN